MNDIWFGYSPDDINTNPNYYGHYKQGRQQAEIGNESAPLFVICGIIKRYRRDGWHGSAIYYIGVIHYHTEKESY